MRSGLQNIQKVNSSLPIHQTGKCSFSVYPSLSVCIVAQSCCPSVLKPHGHIVDEHMETKITEAYFDSVSL